MSTETKPAPVQAPAAKLAVLDHKTVLDVNRLRPYCDRLIPQLASALPAAMASAAPRFARCLLTELQRNPYLQTCTGLSLLGGLIQAAQLGLEVGGPLGQAYLVPYWNKKVGANEAQMQVGWRGYCSLAHRSGMTESFYAHAVYSDDEFDLQLGTQPRVIHRPKLIGGLPRTPENVIGVYAAIKTELGGIDVEWMNKAQIDAHKDRYSKAANSEKGPPSPWQTAWEEMARKTPFRRLAKRAPVSVDLIRAATIDEYGDEGVPQNLRTLAAEALEIQLEPERSDHAAEVADKLPAPNPPAGKGGAA